MKQIYAERTSSESIRRRDAELPPAEFEDTGAISRCDELSQGAAELIAAAEVLLEECDDE